MTLKGKYTPINISKYKGNWRNIVHRSGWERQVMKYLDENEMVIEWSSEELIIPYFDPIENRKRRYFPDFWIKVKRPDGTFREYLWEVKPHAQAIQPVLSESATKSQKRRYALNVRTYVTNNAKWEAAREICRQKGWTFHVVTEKQLASLTGKKKV